MAHVATISSKGQLVIPAPLRKKYRLTSGTRVAIEDSDGRITVRPNASNAILGLGGLLSSVEEDVEAWWLAEKARDRGAENSR